MAFKTYEKWEGSLGEYLEIGDFVDKEMVNYFVNVLPPVTLKYHCIQMGEPYNHIDGYPTYATLERTENGWMFAGHCFRGETEQPD